MEYKVKKPVAFTIFNRPDLTRQVFEAIRQVRPAEFFVIADGPRNEEEKILTEKTRAIIDEVDWPCQVHRNFSDKNLGGKWRPYTGISWVFERVDEAIILEDDDVPNTSFFRYCDELLERFRDDNRIFSISGANFHKPKTPDKYSYWFSSLQGVWGYATWKRSWEKVDMKMTKWGDLREANWLKSKIPDKQIREMYKSKLDRVYYDTYKGKVGLGYAWLFAMMLDNALDVRPKKNLVSNVGFRPDANNTTEEEEYANFPKEELDWPLRHPPVFENWVNRDIQVYREMDPNINFLKYNLKQIPVIGKILIWGKKTMGRISRIYARIAKSFRIDSDYRFSFSDYFTYIFEELAHKKMKIKELSNNQSLSGLQINNFKFYWPENQPRKELSALWQEVFNPRILNPHAYENSKVKIKPGDVVIDAGVAEGFFTHHALQKNARVIGFEPLNILKKCLEKTFIKEINNGQVKLIQALLGDENRISGISADPDMLCYSCQDESDEAQPCPMITLDQRMEDDKISRVDFIKMDIEGGEVNAFKGAEKLIRKFKPKLAIAVYHEYENAKLIRDMLKTYRPDYRIKFRGIWDFDSVKPRPNLLYAY